MGKGRLLGTKGNSFNKCPWSCTLGTCDKQVCSRLMGRVGTGLPPPHTHTLFLSDLGKKSLGFPLFLGKKDPTKVAPSLFKKGTTSLLFS